jgi:RND family efflux transporter MFP subunit
MNTMLKNSNGKPRSSALLVVGFGVILTGSLAFLQNSVHAEIDAKTNNAKDANNSTASKSSDGKIAPTKPALTVTVIQAATNNVALKLAANGSLAAWQEAVVGSESSGLRISELHVNIGDVVKRGQLLVSFASESVKADVAQAQAALNEVNAVAADATSNADRARGLQSSGAISKQQIGQYLTTEQTAKARVAAAKATLDVQTLRLKYTQVLAPDNGVISARTASVGAVVGNGAELFRMIRQGRLEWRAEVTSSELSRIPVGTEVHLFAPNGTQARGKVRMIAPTVDAQTRTGLVYVDLLNIETDMGTSKNKGDKANVLLAFKPGMFARGEFVLGNSPAMTIPQQAVVVRDGFSYAFKLNTDQRVTQIKLQTGRRMMTEQGEQVEIVSGLSPNSTIVASGAGFLNDGDLVKVVAATAVGTPATNTPKK